MWLQISFSLIVVFGLCSAASETSDNAWPRPDSTGECQPEYSVYYGNPLHKKNTMEHWGYKKIKGDRVKIWQQCGKLCYDSRGCTHWNWLHGGREDSEQPTCYLSDHSQNTEYVKIWNTFHGSFNCFSDITCQ